MAARRRVSDGRWVGPHPDHRDPVIRNESWWHLTTKAHWAYDPAFRPRRAVGLGADAPAGWLHTVPGAMLGYWLPYVAPDESAAVFAVRLDLGALTDGQYHRPVPGGHPELIITDPAAVVVAQVMTFDQALAYVDDQFTWRPAR